MFYRLRRVYKGTWMVPLTVVISIGAFVMWRHIDISPRTNIISAHDIARDHISAYQIDINNQSLIHMNENNLLYKALPPMTTTKQFSDIIDFNLDRVFIPRVKHEQSRTKYSIPKIIHFMWTNNIIPIVFINNVKSFIKNHKTWTFYFWTYKLAREFIVDNYPSLVQTFDGYIFNVNKSDMIRVLVIYHYGGAYFDLDTRSIKPLDDITEKETCVLTPEPIEHAVFAMGMLSLLNTCAMMCIPRHALFKYIISLLVLPQERKNVMFIAGPVFITEAVRSFVLNEKNLNLKSSDTFHIVSNELFLDRIKPDIRNALSEECNLTMHMYKSLACTKWRQRGGKGRSLSRKAYTDHMYYGTTGKMKQLRYSKEARFDLVIPNLKTYKNKF